LARNALACFGLETGGVEMAIPASEDGLDATNGVVVGVDSTPDLAFHRSSGEILPLRVGARYLDELGFRHNCARVPIAAVTGTNGKTTTCLMLDRILRFSGVSTGLACTDGVYFNGKRQKKGIFSGISGALQVFAKESVQAAILETSRGTLLKRGLAFDRCDVAACTNVAGDHLGEDGVATLDQLAYVKAVVIRAARDCVVLNGDDARCVRMLEGARAKRVILVYGNDDAPTLPTGLPKHSEAIVCERTTNSAQLVWRHHEESVPIVDVGRIPAAWGGTALHNVVNAMFATGLAMGLGATVEQIRSALESFDTSTDSTPGRLNVYDELPFRVIVDYVHNAHGFAALCQFVRAAHSGGKRIAIVSCQERHRSVDREAIADTISETFDLFICRDPIKLKEAQDGAIADRMREALVRAGVPETKILVVPKLPEALEQGLVSAGPGDLLVIGATGHYDAVWKQVQAFRDGKLLTDLSSSDQRCSEAASDPVARDLETLTPS